MRRIDLTCLITAPIVTGLLLAYAGNLPTAAYLVLLNLASWLPEVYCLTASQRWSPALRRVLALLCAAQA